MRALLLILWNVVFIAVPLNGKSVLPVRLDTLGCQDSVRDFLSRPAKKDFATLSGPNGTECWKSIKSSNDNLNRLNRWAGQGNRWAGQYLAQHLKMLDGGALEDALRSLGQFATVKMQTFLTFSKTGVLTRGEFRDALTMLPLSLADDQKAQLKALNERKEQVLRVSRKDLLAQRREALKDLDDFASEIRSSNPK